MKSFSAYNIQMEINEYYTDTNYSADEPEDILIINEELYNDYDDDYMNI
jgi:hypothetical protein